MEAINRIAGRISTEEVRMPASSNPGEVADVNYVVSLLGELRIEPALKPESVAMLNHEFEITYLLVDRPEVWAAIRFRIAYGGGYLVLDEEPTQHSIQGWGTFLSLIHI